MNETKIGSDSDMPSAIAEEKQPDSGVIYKSGQLLYKSTQGGCVLYSEDASENADIYVVTTAHIFGLKEEFTKLTEEWRLHDELSSQDFHRHFQCILDRCEVKFGHFEVSVLTIVASGLFVRLADIFQSGGDRDYDWVVLGTALQRGNIPIHVDVQYRNAASNDPCRLLEYISQRCDYNVYLPDGSIVTRESVVEGYSGCLASRGILTFSNRLPYELVGIPDSTWGIVSTESSKISHCNWMDHINSVELMWKTSNHLGLLVMPDDGFLSKDWASISNVGTNHEDIKKYLENKTSEKVLEKVLKDSPNFKENQYPDLLFVACTTWKFCKGNGDEIASGSFDISNMWSDGTLHFHSVKNKNAGQIHAEVLGICKVLHMFLTSSEFRRTVKFINLEFRMDKRRDRPIKPCPSCLSEFEALEEAMKSLNVVFKISWSR